MAPRHVARAVRRFGRAHGPGYGAALIASRIRAAAYKFSASPCASAPRSWPGRLHYLAFDLLIGTWEARDARERQLPHLLLVPCLFLTLMFGPLGWLTYMGVRTLRPQPSAPRAI
jgi:hypothetical protein